MIIKGKTIPECWLKILSHISKNSGTEISPLLIKIEDSDERPSYQDSLETDINKFLININQAEIETTAGTIFPISLSNGKTSIFERYERIWKSVKRERKNYKGTYFRRLTSYGQKYLSNATNIQPVNQLQTIIDTYNKGIHRRSALIATTFDPLLDHKPTKQLGFPCLQQVCFIPDAKKKTLSMNAVYAMQYIDIRAYGNYLGLMRLGRFMAAQMGLSFTDISCMISVAALGTMKKVEANGLVNKYCDEAKL